MCWLIVSRSEFGIPLLTQPRREKFSFSNDLRTSIGMIGLALLGYLKPSGVRYFGVFLATIACNANCPVLLTSLAISRASWPAWLRTRL
ncbi:hypothetical protein VTK56DRAFT_3395 [Thermocarpiscus australiensis]